MSQGIPSSTAGFGGNYQGYNAFIQPALNKPISTQPSVAQQLSRLQQSQQINQPDFQDLYEKTVSEKPKIQAQQAVQPKIQETQKSVDTSSLPIQKSGNSSVSEKPVTNVGQDYYQQLAPLIEDVQNIAKNSGYVDVRADDVMRAYAQGSSLLADYSV